MGLNLSVPNPISSIVGVVQTVLDRVLPDKQANDAAKSQIAQMIVKGELDAVMGQIQTNIAEAQTGHWYEADWRPTFGYVGAFAFAYSYILQPILTCVLAVYKPIAVQYLPKLDMSALMPIALGMLGLSATHFADPMGNGKN